MAELRDTYAEEAVLGAIFIRNEAMDDVIDLLEPEHFGRDHLRRIFCAMVKLHRENIAIDLVTLMNALRQSGDLDEVGGAGVIANLASGMERSSNAVHYANLIRGKWLLRELRLVGQRLVGDTEATDADPSEILEASEGALFALGGHRKAATWVSGADIADQLVGHIQTLYETRAAISGVPSGLAELDDMTRGFQPGDLVVIGARPSMGKSAFGMQIAMRAAKDGPVAVFSLEMGNAQLGLRAVTAAAGVNNWRVQRGYIGDEEFSRIGDGLRTLTDSEIYLDDSPVVSPIHVRSRLRRLKAQTNGRLRLVVIDYLQLMATLPEHRRENRTTQVGGISRALKILAREFNVAFVVLAQLNRGNETRADKRPQLSDLRESGAIEQDADVVLLLHRPEYYDPANTELSGKAEIIVAKQRNGPTALLNFRFSSETMTFRDVEAE